MPVRNRARDGRNLNEVKPLGWKTLTVSLCELADMGRLLLRMIRFVDGPTNLINKNENNPIDFDL